MYTVFVVLSFLVVIRIPDLPNIIQRSPRGGQRYHWLSSYGAHSFSKNPKYAIFKQAGVKWTYLCQQATDTEPDILITNNVCYANVITELHIPSAHENFSQTYVPQSGKHR
jgi:hypothetical protein